MRDLMLKKKTFQIVGKKTSPTKNPRDDRFIRVNLFIFYYLYKYDFGHYDLQSYEVVALII